jgi:hypothetical protein
MTRRDRLERRAEKRMEWAEKSKAKAEQRFRAAHKIVESIPLGQPILVGHHSERGHRAALDRMASNMDKGCDLQAKASTHTSKAGNLEDFLARAIFADDPDAIERLTERSRLLTEAADKRRDFNTAWRKAGKPALGEEIAKWDALFEQFAMGEHERRAVSTAMKFAPRADAPPFPSYSLTNLRARARTDLATIEKIKRTQVLQERAESAPNGVLVTGEEYVNVRFAEFPGRQTIDELKAAGFSWVGGSWGGYRAKLPESVASIIRG